MPALGFFATVILQSPVRHSVSLFEFWTLAGGWLDWRECAGLSHRTVSFAIESATRTIQSVLFAFFHAHGWPRMLALPLLDAHA